MIYFDISREERNETKTKTDDGSEFISSNAFGCSTREAVFANVKQDNIVNTKLMSGDTEKSGGGSEASEYGNLVGSDTISGSDITWSVYDSGKLVIEGTGATPDWSPLFEYK